MNRYLVTGGSGFIGTNLVEFHKSQGDRVLNLDLRSPKCGAHADLWVQVNLCDAAAVARVFEEFRPTHVYHLGARTDLDGKAVRDYQENTRGVENVIQACTKSPELKRVIFASSRLVCRIGYRPMSYEDYCPSTAYGESKVLGESVVRRLDAQSWDWCIVRPTSIWGPWFDEPYRNFFDAVKKRVYVHPRHARISKSFGYVGNTVHQLSRLMEVSGVHGHTFYLADYEPIDVYDLASRIANAFNVRPPVHVPQSLLKGLAIFGDLATRCGLRPPLTSFRLSNLMTPMMHDLDDLKEYVGTLPFDLQSGVDETTAWMKRHG